MSGQCDSLKLRHYQYSGRLPVRTTGTGSLTGSSGVSRFGGGPECPLGWYSHWQCHWPGPGSTGIMSVMPGNFKLNATQAANLKGPGQCQCLSLPMATARVDSLNLENATGRT